MRKETKMAGAAHGGVAELTKTFEAFKAANDARLADLERGRADVLDDERLARIDRALTEQKSALDRLARSQQRPALAREEKSGEHRAAWIAFLRRGDESALAQLEVKALSVGSNPDGGYVAPPELDRMIEARLREVSPMRAIATVRTSGATVFRKPVSIAHAATGWTSETGARAGAAFVVTAGCDKRFATCREKFANAENFRGFPHMPGDDALIAGADPAAAMDGGSRFSHDSA